MKKIDYLVLFFLINISFMIFIIAIDISVGWLKVGSFLFVFFLGVFSKDIICRSLEPFKSTGLWSVKIKYYFVSFVGKAFLLSVSSYVIFALAYLYSWRKATVENRELTQITFGTFDYLITKGEVDFILVIAGFLLTLLGTYISVSEAFNSEKTKLKKILEQE